MTCSLLLHVVTQVKFRCMKHSWNMAEAFGPFTRHEQRHASETRFSCKSLLCLTGTWQLTAFFSGGRLPS